MQQSAQRPEPRLFIVDFDLIDFGGHFLNQVLGLREAASACGFEALTFIPRSADLQVATILNAQRILPVVPRRQADRDEVLNSFANGFQALSPLWEAIEGHRPNPSDMLLITSLRAMVIYALGVWLNRLRPEARPAVFFRSIGFEFFDFRTMTYNGEAWAYRFALKDLASRSGADRVFVTVNNQELLASTEQLAMRRAFFMPVPKYYGDDATPAPPIRSDATTVYVHVKYGSAAPQQIGDAIQRLRGRHGLKFLVKFCQPLEDRDPARSIFDDGVRRGDIELLPTTENHVQYLRTLARSDIVLLPYDPARYRLLTSGVFCEAASYGKVAVVPDKTWMADQIADGRAAGVLFPEPTAVEMSAAILQAVQEFPRLRAEALPRAAAFRAENSCRRNLELMLGLVREPQDMRLSYVPPIDMASVTGVPNYLGAGWSIIEPGLGVWTDGDTAELKFPVRPSSGALILRTNLRPFIVRQRPNLRLRVCFNRKEVAVWYFNFSNKTDLDWCWREAVIAPGTLAANNNDTRVTLHVDTPTSPRELGISDDARRLGVMLRKLSLTTPDQGEGFYPPGSRSPRPAY
jgi:hypothetical protein